MIKLLSLDTVYFKANQTANLNHQPALEPLLMFWPSCGASNLYGAALQRPSAQVVPSGQAEQAGPWVVGWLVGWLVGIPGKMVETQDM